jgi:hypothetical protein
MAIKATLAAGGLSDEQFDRLAREFQNDIARLSDVDLINQEASVPSPGHRGDPITLGSFALALVTSGTVTALFAIVKSYVERGIEGSFEGVDGNGKPVKISLKGISSLEQFKAFLTSAGVLK